MSKVPSQSEVHPWPVLNWPQFMSLEENVQTEILVIGAGIAGLTTAYHLAKEGKKVIVIDASMPGDGETGNTSAHLSSALDEYFLELESTVGREGSRLAADSHRTAIDTIEAICAEEGIDCQFERVDGYLFASKKGDESEIRMECDAASRAGFHDLELQAQSPYKNFDQLTLRFPRQAQFEPLSYLKGLAQALMRMGVPIYTHCEAVEFKAGSPIQVKMQKNFVIIAQDIVVATNTPVNDRFALHTKQAPYRTYVCSFEIDSEAFPKGLFWDSEDPYHYVRTHTARDGQTLLIVGGEDHKVGQDDNPEERWKKIEVWTRTNIPEAKQLVKRWSGQVNEPVDGLAFIGRNPGDDHIFVVTGDSGHGLTHGTIAGILIRDLIMGRPNHWEKIYSPSRINPHAQPLQQFFKENFNVAAQYRDYLTAGDVARVEDIKLGEGAILRHGLSKVAVYRDHDNKLHCKNAVCPHLGALVRWNKAEMSWDCPCHGSRFNVEGEVINGPAVSGLKAVSLGQLREKTSEGREMR